VVDLGVGQVARMRGQLGELVAEALGALEVRVPLERCRSRGFGALAVCGFDQLGVRGEVRDTVLLAARVDPLEDRREGAAEFEAEPARVADVEDPIDLG